MWRGGWVALVAGCVDVPAEELVDCPDDYEGVYSVLGGTAKDHVTIEAQGTRCVVELVVWTEDECSLAEALALESVAGTGIWSGESGGVRDCGEQGPAGPAGAVVFQRGADDRFGILGSSGLLALLPSPLVLERVSP